MTIIEELTADEVVQRDVLDELHWDPEVRPTDIGVEVRDGVVTLTGTVSLHRERRAAAEAALRVFGVRGIANDIVVHPFPHRRTDSELARVASQALQWDPVLPENRVKVRVTDGWLTLEGTVAHHYQKALAEGTVERLAGVRGVTNNVEIDPERARDFSPAQLKEEIEKAFIRNAEIDARRISIRIDDGTVMLYGNVRSWSERRQAVRSAWSLPGVHAVEDILEVTP